MGRPTNNSMWSAEEAAAFRWFATPNELAEALGSEDERTKSAAVFAMNAITHLRRNMAWTLGSPAKVAAAADRIIAACPLDQLDTRLPAMLRSMGMQPQASDARAEHLHVRPEGPSTRDELSAEGTAALQNFWAQDFDLYRYCLVRFGGEVDAGLRAEADQAAANALDL